MDLDTFMTTLYVWIDDWYKSQMAAQIKRHPGPEAEMSDSEVLTVAVAQRGSVAIGTGGGTLHAKARSAVVSDHALTQSVQ